MIDPVVDARSCPWRISAATADRYDAPDAGMCDAPDTGMQDAPDQR
jgi:hypothetical protein